MKILLSILLLTLYATTFSQTSGTIRTGASGTDTNFVRNVYERNDSLFKELNGSEVFVGMLGSASGVVYDTSHFRIVSGGGYDTVKLKNEPPKEYIALISQSDTSAPMVTVLKDDFGDITLSYITTGQYYATSSGAQFTSNKTDSWVTNNVVGDNTIHTEDGSTANIFIITKVSGVETDGVLGNMPSSSGDIRNVLHIVTYP